VQGEASVSADRRAVSRVCARLIGDGRRGFAGALEFVITEYHSRECCTRATTVASHHRDRFRGWKSDRGTRNSVRPLDSLVARFLDIVELRITLLLSSGKDSALSSKLSEDCERLIAIFRRFLSTSLTSRPRDASAFATAIARDMAIRISVLRVHRPVI